MSPIWSSEAVNRRSDNAMAKRKTNNDLKNVAQKAKLIIESREPNETPGVNSGAPEG